MIEIGSSAALACPYCGQVFSWVFRDAFAKEIITCDLEEGGCDRDFVADIHCTLTVNIQEITEERAKYTGEEVVE